MNLVFNILKDEITQKGPISFSRFMDAALYTPSHGYYERQKQIGCRGDFYTSVSAGPLFGQLLGVYFADCFEQIIKNETSVPQRPHQRSSFQILEAGAHDGRLANDIMGAL